MSKNISICLSIDIPVDKPVDWGNVRIDGDTIERIKRYYSNPDIYKKIIRGYHTTMTGGLNPDAVCGKAFNEGDEVYYINENGVACKGKIKSVQYQVDSSPLFVGRVFHSMDDLCEHLKRNVHG